MQGTIKSLGVELPGPPQHEQAAANTTVLLRRQFPAPGPLRRHQWHVRVRLASRSSLRLWPPDSQTFDGLIQPLEAAAVTVQATVQLRADRIAGNDQQVDQKAARADLGN